jgi:hypothetical protein
MSGTKSTGQEKIPENSLAEASELNQRIWAVVSFDKCEAANLTYHEAAQKMAELDDKKVAGLCIVTSESAAKLLG